MGEWSHHDSMETAPPSTHFYVHLNARLNLIPLSLGAGSYAFLHQYGADIDPKAASNDPALLEKARQAGMKLVNQPGDHRG